MRFIDVICFGFVLIDGWFRIDFEYFGVSFKLFFRKGNLIIDLCSESTFDLSFLSAQKIRRMADLVCTSVLVFMLY